MLTQAAACPISSAPDAAELTARQHRRRQFAIDRRDWRRLPRTQWEADLEFIRKRVPPGAVRVPHGQRFLDAVMSCPLFVGRRADWWRSALAVARGLAATMDLATSTSRPGWDELGERAGVSRTTVYRRLKDFERAGLLGVVASGQLAHTDLNDPEHGNFAGVYVLCERSGLEMVETAVQAAPAPAKPEPRNEADAVGPIIPPAPAVSPGTPVTHDASRAPKPLSGTPSVPSGPDLGVCSLSLDPPTRASFARGLDDQGLINFGPWWDGLQVPRTRDERWLAALELRRLEPVLRKISTAAVRSLCRPLFLAGATISDIRRMMNERPDGTPWPHTLTADKGQIRHVPGWFRYRMLAWRSDSSDPNSALLPTPSQLLAAAAERNAQAAAERAAAAAAAQAERVALEDCGTVPDELAAARAKAARATARVRIAEHRASTPPAAAATPAQPAPAAPVPPRRSTRRGGLRLITETPDSRVAALRAAARGVR